MNNHIRLLGILFIVHGILSAFAGLILLLLFSAGRIGHLGMSELSILTIIMKILALFLISRGLPDIICGAGLLAKKKWSRILGIIMSIIATFSVPVGTALGVYGLWVLFKPETEQLLKA